jgi:hypothetical protein
MLGVFRRGFGMGLGRGRFGKGMGRRMGLGFGRKFGFRNLYALSEAELQILTPEEKELLKQRLNEELRLLEERKKLIENLLQKLQ